MSDVDVGLAKILDQLLFLSNPLQICIIKDCSVGALRWISLFHFTCLAELKIDTAVSEINLEKCYVWQGLTKGSPIFAFFQKYRLSKGGDSLCGSHQISLSDSL